MTKEIMYLRFLQFAVLIMTPLLFYGIVQAAKGNIKLHKKINGSIFVVVMIAVVGLVLSTAVFGFDYKTISTDQALINIGPEKMSTRLIIHRIFSNFLFISLLITTFSGTVKKYKLHRSVGKLTLFFWMGTLISAWFFF
jgi:uncharacterized membrane protein YozB (DUF420 family)